MRDALCGAITLILMGEEERWLSAGFGPVWLQCRLIQKAAKKWKQLQNFKLNDSLKQLTY